MSVIDFALVSLFFLVCMFLDFTLTVVAKKILFMFIFSSNNYCIFTCIRALITIRYLLEVLYSAL
jgi:hypothetical protein